MDWKRFTVIVADDEDELRQAVCRLIPWEELGFTLIGDASNGLDALQLVEQLQPDLLLTDIQMPFITGTSLARQVRELQPLIQIAFLSGYDDFEYARLAIEEDVISYLLKPISMAELTEAVREIRGKMETRFRYLVPGELGGDSLPLAVASLLLDACSERLGEEALRQSLADCGMALSVSSELTVLCTETGGMRPDQNTARTVDRVLGKYYGACSIASGGRVLTLLAAGEDGFPLLGAALDELNQAIRRLLCPECTIGVSRRFTALSDAVSACREASEIQRLPGDSGIRYCQLGGEPGGERRSGGVSALCERALRIIEQRYMDEGLSLAAVSEELHVSPNYLSANMKKYAGDTFINLLIQKRMEAALSLLSSGKLRVAEVAARCGYTDQHYFSFCFKKYYGISPTRTRRREDGA